MMPENVRQRTCQNPKSATRFISFGNTDLESLRRRFQSNMCLNSDSGRLDMVASARNREELEPDMLVSADIDDTD